MPTSYCILVDGAPAADLMGAASTIEIEENLDLPSAMSMHLPVSRSAKGDLTMVSERRFRPFADLSFVATTEAGPQCLFDGLVLSHKLHVARSGTQSTLEVWGEDASWLMNLEEKVKEWADVTDSSVAASIFGDYDIAPAAANGRDDSPSHIESKHTLMQRATDIQFLRMLARRNGKLCWVAAGEKPGRRTGYFVRPNLQGTPAAVLSLAGGAEGNIEALDFEWDVTRPTAVRARQAVFDKDDADGVGGLTRESGLPLLAERGLSSFAGRSMTVMLTAAVDGAGELTMRSQSLLRESGWFARCRGVADLARVKKVLRPGTVVRVDAAGSVSSGRYFVWSVRHTITQQTHRMAFQLVRNAVGPAARGGGSFA
jgi:hypothetical protein